MHEFAIHTPLVDSWPSLPPTLQLLNDHVIVHRLRKVLRLEAGAQVILFGVKHAFRCRIISYEKEKSVQLQPIEQQPVTPPQPDVQLYLPLLERPAFEEAIRAATVLGITTIRPFRSDKTKRHDCSTSERERLQRIMIAAAEQSKQFHLPPIAPEEELATILPTLQESIYFDAQGDFGAHELVALQTTSPISVIFGPEGDFTDEEKTQLKAQGISSYRLTNSILRSEDAVMVGIGLLRTLLRS